MFVAELVHTAGKYQSQLLEEISCEMFGKDFLKDKYNFAHHFITHMKL